MKDDDCVLLPCVCVCVFVFCVTLNTLLCVKDLMHPFFLLVAAVLEANARKQEISSFPFLGIPLPPDLFYG